MKNKNIKIGIIGFGRFGTLAAAVLAEHFEILVWNRTESDEMKKKAEKLGVKFSSLGEAARADVVILSVPMSQTEKTIQKIAPLLRDGALVLDTCSVKIHPCRWLEKNIKNKKVEIMGTHPMFGPVTSKFDLDKKNWNLKDLQIVLCPLRVKKERLEKIKKFLSEIGLKVMEKTPAEHDRQNAYTLGLVHLLGRALVAAGAREQEIFTPGYVDLLKIIPHTASDNWQLFFDMHNLNPYSEKIRRKFYTACDQLEDKIILAKEQKNLEFWRKLIDETDQKIFELLEKRFFASEEIGKIKKSSGKDIVDSKREEEIIMARIKKTKLSSDFVAKIYQVIFFESYKKQR